MFRAQRTTGSSSIAFFDWGFLTLFGTRPNDTWICLVFVRCGQERMQRFALIGRTHEHAKL